MRIIMAGVILIVYMFIIVVGYFVVSPIYSEFMDVMEGMDAGEASDEIAQHASTYRSFFDWAFALMAVIPSIWFIVWVFRREPDWRYRGY